jgi:hypothetical protein
MINFRKTLLLVGIILLSLLSSNAARVYFDNSYSNWSTVYIYSWNGGTKYTGNWPGTQMYKLDGTDNIYYYDLSESSNVMVIFNTKITENGNEKTLQTGDLTFN